MWHFAVISSRTYCEFRVQRDRQTYSMPWNLQNVFRRAWLNPTKLIAGDRHPLQDEHPRWRPRITSSGTNTCNEKREEVLRRFYRYNPEVTWDLLLINLYSIPWPRQCYWGRPGFDHWGCIFKCCNVSCLRYHTPSTVVAFVEFPEPGESFHYLANGRNTWRGLQHARASCSWWQGSSYLQMVVW